MNRVQILCFYIYIFLQSGIIEAQPVISQAGIIPSIGNVFTYKSCSESINPGGSGPDQTWDLTTISDSLTFSTIVIDPSTTSYGSQFNNANIAYDTPGSGIDFMKYTSSVFQNYGIVQDSGSMVLPYNDPEDVLRFPLTYNDSFSDTWDSHVSIGYELYRYGETIVTADSYGTLITPNGTYSNVLRVHIHRYYTDSAVFSGFIIKKSYNFGEYLWYKEGFHTSLASVYSLLTSLGDHTYGGNYLSDGSGVSVIPEMLSSLSVYPNPASDYINIKAVLPKSGETEIIITDITGKQILVEQRTPVSEGENNFKIDASALCPGMYVLTVKMHGIAMVRRPLSIVE